MPEMAEVLGIDKPIVIDGKEYQLAVPDSHILAEFEDWLNHRALERIERQRGQIPDDVYQARHKAAIQLIAGGEMGVGTRSFNAALSSLEGTQYLVYLCMRARNSDVTKELVSRFFRGEVNSAILARLEELAKEQKAKEAAATTAG